MLSRFFGLERLGTTPATEARAGVVTFLTTAYILFVNPQILSQAGMPAGDVVIATALSAGLATLLMGLWARFPFALAPGMGLNAYFAFGVVGGLGVSWQVALGAVFVEGLLFLLLSVTGVRSALLDTVPQSLKLAATGGIGLFLAFIGLQGCGLVKADPNTLLRLGDVAEPTTLLAIAGLVTVAALMTLRIPGALLWGILGVAGISWLSGLADGPESWLAAPRLPRETFFALDLSGLLSGSLWLVVLTFLFVDLLDTAGTLIGVAHHARLVDEHGELPGSDRAFAADAVGTSLGALLGTSTVTTYIESAAGVEEGGRSGLVAVVAGSLFLLAIVLVPVFVAVPAIATAPALIVVGAMMMRPLRKIEWSRVEDGVPAFLTLALMPFTYSIANGLAAGIVSYVAIQVLAGRFRKLSPTLTLLAVLLVLYYAFLSPG